MASPAAIERSPLPPPSSAAASSPLQRLSTFKDRPTTTATTPLSSLTPTTTTSPPTTTPLDSFANDPIFSAFLSPSFDSTKFSSSALSSGSAAARAESLQDAIRLLQKQLRSEVLSRHSDLLSQLSSVKETESSLSTIRSAISSLQSSVKKVRSEVADPNRQIRTQTLQLSNLHSTFSLLQLTTRSLRLIKKLRDVISVGESSNSLDLSKAAQLHYEILSLVDENDLTGISVIDEELKWVNEAGNKLRIEGMRVLERGLEGFNQAEVGAGLQVFYNLGELRSTVDGLISKYKNLGVKSVSTALDMKAISGGGGGFGGGPGGIQRSGTPQIGSGAKAKDALWQRMSNCMDHFHSIVVAVWHLQRVLSKKRDPFTHVLLLDEVMKVSQFNYLLTAIQCNISNCMHKVHLM